MPWPDGRACTLPGHPARTPPARLTALGVLALGSLWLYLVGSMAEGLVARPVMKRSTAADSGGATSSSEDYSGENRMQRSLSLFNMKREFSIVHKHGVTLEITKDGDVRGTTDAPNTLYGVLLSVSLRDNVNGSAQLNGENSTSPTLLALKGKQTQRYLCMNHSGDAYSVLLPGVDMRLSDDCKWEENFLENRYITYCRDGKPKRKPPRKKKRRRNRRMCLGVNEKGRLMNGRQVNPARDEAMFQNRPTEKSGSSTMFPFPMSTTTPRRPLSAPTSQPSKNRRRRNRKRRRRTDVRRRRPNARPCLLFCVNKSTRKQARRRHQNKRRKSKRRHRSRTHSRAASTSWPLFSVNL